MHVLVTADTLSGVWTYTRELVTGLVTRGVRVTLVSFGEIPLPHQTSWMDTLRGLTYIPTGFRLDWMQEGELDIKDSAAYLTGLVSDLKPDLLHLNQACYGNLPVTIPRIVVANGDWISWWQAVHGCGPEEGRWLRWYRDTVIDGLLGADVVVGPTSWMLETVRDCYISPPRETVIYSGRNPIFFNPYNPKEDSVLAIGRLWDAGKQVSMLMQHTHPLSVCIVGSEPSSSVPRLPIRADVKFSLDSINVSFKGPQTDAQLRTLYSRAAIYAATSRYEPFGMNALEAALSKCAIVANDIPSHREIWGEAAIYFRANDAGSLARVIRRLSEDRDLCRTFASRAYHRARDRFTAKRMVDDYLELYQEVLATQRAVA